MTPFDVFPPKVAANVCVDGGGCWLWTGGGTRLGYVRLRISGKAIDLHRYAYEKVNGPMPPKLVSDHLCRVKHCVNPAHIEAVTNRENVLRGDAAGGKLRASAAIPTTPPTRSIKALTGEL